MYAHGEAEHVHRLYDVGGPVAALFVRLNLRNHHVVLLVAVWGDVERGEEHLSAVLHACEEVDDFLLLLNHTFLLFLAVGYSLRFEDAIPKAVGNLDVVFDGSRVLQLRFLRHADEPLDVVPIPTEQRAVIGNGIIGRVRGGHTADDGILAALVLLVLHAILKVRPGCMKIEEFDLLDVSLLHHLPPVGVEKVRDVAVFVRFGEATITRFLPQQPDDLRAVCVEDDDRDAKREVFEVLAHPEEVRSRKALKIIKCIDSGCFFVL